MRRAVAGLFLAALLAGCSVTSGSMPVPVAAPAGVPVVVTLGDSVPAGTACDCDPFPTLYAKAQRAVSENLAQAGYTSADVKAQVPGVRAALAGADLLVLMIGANDLAEAFDDGTSYGDAADTMRDNVVATIGEVEAIRAMPVVVLGYWNVVKDGQVGFSAYGKSGMQQAMSATDFANDGLVVAAGQTGATYISTEAAFHGSDGTQDPTNLLASDGDHPNAAGHAAIAALLPPITSLRPASSQTGAQAETQAGAQTGAQSVTQTATPSRSDPG